MRMTRIIIILIHFLTKLKDTIIIKYGFYYDDIIGGNTIINIERVEINKSGKRKFTYIFVV